MLIPQCSPISYFVDGGGITIIAFRCLTLYNGDGRVSLNSFGSKSNIAL